MQKKVVGKPFKKGHKLSVGHGRPKLPPEIKAIRDIDKWRLLRIYTDLTHRNVEEIDAIYDRRKKSSAKEFAVVSILRSVFDDGNYKAWEALVSRLFGKPPETIKLGNDGDKPFVVDLTQSRQKVADVMARLEKRALKEKLELEKQKKQKNRSELNPA